MSEQIGLLLIGACGFALLAMLAGIFLYRWFRGMIGRFFIIGIVNKIIGDTKEDADDVGSDLPRQMPRHMSRADMEARAESLDFDTAVAKHQHPDAPPLTAQSARPNPPAPEPLRHRDEPHMQPHDDDEADDALYDD